MRKQIAKGLVHQDNFNVYRGCDHGCIYCDARSTVYQIDGLFSDVIVKGNAPELMEAYLKRKRSKTVLVTGGMSDPYNHVEKKEEVFLQVLKVIKRYGFGIYLLTKSSLVERDLELIKTIHYQYKAVVAMTLTTTDDQLASKIEPHVSLPSERLNTLKLYAHHGIMTGVWFCPVLPFLCDTISNVQAVVRAAAAAGVSFIVNFGMGTTMRDGSREYFYDALDRLYPGMKEQYQKQYHRQYVCDSPRAKELYQAFKEECEQHHVVYDWNEIQALIREPNVKQLSLFDE